MTANPWVIYAISRQARFAWYRIDCQNGRKYFLFWQKMSDEKFAYVRKKQYLCSVIKKQNT